MWKCHRLLLLQAWLVRPQNNAVVKVCVGHQVTDCSTNPVICSHQQNTASAALWNQSPVPRETADFDRAVVKISLMVDKNQRPQSRQRDFPRLWLHYILTCIQVRYVFEIHWRWMHWRQCVRGLGNQYNDLKQLMLQMLGLFIPQQITANHTFKYNYLTG